jgi:antitoxin (DNA-binding transcriptional repressor) of toxin-antitoxin stability system
MRTVTATTANRSFSKLAHEVSSNGESIIVVLQGKPHVRIAPVNQKYENNPAWDELMAHLKCVQPTGASKWTKEEIYDEALCSSPLIQT